LSGAGFGAAAVQFEGLRRLLDDLERQKPDTVPCSRCEKPVPVEHIIIRDAKVFCEQCYTELYIKK